MDNSLCHTCLGTCPNEYYYDRYSGTLSFGCEFKEIDSYNALSKAIDKAASPNIRKSQGALAWGVSSMQERTAQNALRLELLRKARLQAKEFSKETGMECEVNAVRFGGIPHPIPMMAKGMVMSAMESTESPIRQDETTTLEATVDFTCSERVP